MKVEELRVGNLVTGLYEPVAIVKSIHEDELWDGGYYIITEKNKTALGMMIGIPFTEEWLSKLSLSKEFLLQDCKIEIFQHFADDTIWFFNINNSLVIEFKHVHEAQNIYYVLSEGEELTIKELTFKDHLNNTPHSEIYSLITPSEWDKINEMSFGEELITKEEFDKRLKELL